MSSNEFFTCPSTGCDVISWQRQDLTLVEGFTCPACAAFGVPSSEQFHAVTLCAMQAIRWRGGTVVNA